MKFNIYRQEMYGLDYVVTQVEAETKEDALSKYLKDNQIAEDDEWLFYATNAERFICHSCGKHFDYPDSQDECLGEWWGIPYHETTHGCPHCGSGEFEEVEG